MIDTIQLKDFQNNIDEYLYRIRTGKCYYLQDKTTNRKWLLKPYKEAKMVTVQLDLELETIKMVQLEAKQKKLTFDQMITYILLHYVDGKVEMPKTSLRKAGLPKKVKRSLARKAPATKLPREVRRSAWRK